MDKMSRRRKKRKIIITFIVPTNVVVSRVPERRPTGTPHARAKIARQGCMWQRAYRFFVCAYVFRPMQRNLYQNLSVALLSRAQELPFLLFNLLKLIELIPLHDDIPSSFSSAIGKSGQSNQASKQAINQSRFWLYDDHCPVGSSRENVFSCYLLFCPHFPITLVGRGVRKIDQYSLSKCSLTGPMVGVAEEIGTISLSQEWLL